MSCAESDRRLLNESNRCTRDQSPPLSPIELGAWALSCLSVDVQTYRGAGSDGCSDGPSRATRHAWSGNARVGPVCQVAASSRRRADPCQDHVALMPRIGAQGLEIGVDHALQQRMCGRRLGGIELALVLAYALQ